jgi:outer membrane protein TolC
VLHRRLASVAVAILFAPALLLAQPAPDAPGTPAGASYVPGVVDSIEAEYDAGSAAAPAPPTDAPLVLDAVQVIKLTARFSPEIRQSYERKLAEEARYDFFIYNRSAFSYGAATNFDYVRYHTDASKSLDKTLIPQVFVRKDFYDTTSASMNVGYNLYDFQSGHEANGFVAGRVSVPLVASREALERSSAKIYQQNEVSDARLGYYQRIRNQISNALHNLAWAQHSQARIDRMDAYRADLEALLSTVSSLSGRDTAADAAKVQATLGSACAECESSRNDFAIASETLRNVMGIPFETPIEIASNNWNPFEGENQETLERVALETDEEIKTLINSIRNAQAELDLARKGKWDTRLNMSVARNFTGNGDNDGDADYIIGTGVEVTRIDDRISRSLEQIALANIREYKNAITNRQRDIHTRIVEAYKNLVGQLAEVRTREANLPRYRDDYAKGVELYLAGKITIDEVIQRRKNVLDEQNTILHARGEAHDALTTLVSSTGRYEEYIRDEMEMQRTPGNGAAASPADARSK